MLFANTAKIHKKINTTADTITSESPNETLGGTKLKKSHQVFFGACTALITNWRGSFSFENCGWLKPNDRQTRFCKYSIA